MVAQQFTLLQRIAQGLSNIFARKPPATATGGLLPMSSGQQVLQSIKTGTASLSTGQSGRVLVSGAKVGTGVGIAGAGVAGLGYGLTELSKPITEFTQPIDQLLGFSGVGSIMIIGIIILVLIILLRRKI